MKLLLIQRKDLRSFDPSIRDVKILVRSRSGGFRGSVRPPLGAKSRMQIPSRRVRQRAEEEDVKSRGVSGNLRESGDFKQHVIVLPPKN